MSSENEHDDAQQYGVKVSASAKYEIKKNVTENVPEDVVRAKSLAWLDLISPLTEWAGLRGDQLNHKRKMLRVQQEEALIRVGQIAQDRIKKLGSEKKPIPTKALVPILEKASLEDPDSMLIEAWGNLLASASVNYDSEVITFASILSEIGSRERMIVEEMLGSILPTNWRTEGFPTAETFADALRLDEERIYLQINEAIDVRDDAIFKELGLLMPTGYPGIVANLNKFVFGGDGTTRAKGEFINPYFNEHMMGFHILQRQRLIEFESYPVGKKNGSEWISINTVELTGLGTAFVTRVVARDGQSVR